MKLVSASLALFLLVVAPYSVTRGQPGCNDAPADLQECITREQTNDGTCLNCTNLTPPGGDDCAALTDWYCDVSACCEDCENQVADLAECTSDACGDFEESLCTGTEDLSGCSEAIEAFTSCTVQNCPPDADVICDPNIVDEDTCTEVEAACQFFNACCNNSCGPELTEILATCALGVCAGIDCGAPAPPTVSPAPVAPSPPTTDPGFEGCDEAIAALTDCTLNNCPPDADVICDPNIVDVDTCAEAEAGCQEFSSCCNGQCGPQVEGILATCGFGVCTGIVCTADLAPTEPTAPTPVAPEPTAPAPAPVAEPTEPTAPTPIDRECGTDCCSEALANFAECTIQNCPNFDQSCDPQQEADTCDDVVAICRGFHECCGGADGSGACGSEIEDILATCGLGVCGDIDCTAPPTRALKLQQDKDDRKLQQDKDDRKLQQDKDGRKLQEETFEGCDEAVGALTSCVLNNCPGNADVVCDPDLGDVDTCLEIEQGCQFFTTCCNNSCGNEVEGILATCAFGVCSEAECTATVVPTEPTTPTPVAPTAPAPPTASTTCPDIGVDPGLRCISESVWGYTQCLLNDCPLFDELCVTAEITDNCVEAERVCDRVTTECCNNGCSCELALLMDCALGDLCDPFDCSGGATGRTLKQTGEERKLKQSEEERKLEEIFSPPKARSLQVDCLSERVGIYTQCVVQKCPRADEVCTGTAPEGDSCDDVEAICSKLTSECCPPCESELALLMDCATGEACPPFTCAAVIEPTTPTAPTPTAPTPTDPTTTAPTPSSAGPSLTTMSTVIMVVAAAGIAAAA